MSVQRDSPARAGQAQTRRGILKAAASITVVTFISRLLGLVREQVRGYYLGTGTSSDAFGLASTIPNLFRRLLGEGAMTAAFVPVFTGYQKQEDRCQLLDFLSAFVSLFTFVTTLVCVAGIILSPWIVRTFFSGFDDVEGKVALTIILTQIMFPYLVLICLAAVVQAVLNSFNIFSPSAFTPVLMNLAIIVVAPLTCDLFPDPAYGFAAGFLVGGVLQLLYQLPWFFRVVKGLRFSVNWSHPGVKELIRVFLPGTFAAGIYQINVFVSQIIASTLAEGSIAALQFSLRLQELVLGMFVISMTTVILPAQSRHVVDGDQAAFSATNRFAVDVLAFLTVPATAGLLLLRRPIVALLFRHGAFDEHSTDMTSWAVLFHSFGIYFIGVSRTLNQAFYAMKDLKTPTWVSAISMVVNIAGCYALAIWLEHGGIALASSLSAAVSTVLMFWLLARRGVRLEIVRHTWFVVRLCLACGVMWAALAGLEQVVPLAGSGRGRLLWGLSLHGTAAVAAFAVGALLFARNELMSVADLVRRRFR